MSPIIHNIMSNNLTSKDINFEIIKNEFNFHYKNIISMNKLSYSNIHEISNLEYVKTILNYFDKDKSSILFIYNNLIINQIEYCLLDWKKSLNLEFSTIDKYLLELSKLNDSINHTMSLELKLLNTNTNNTNNTSPSQHNTKNEYINLKLEIFKKVNQIIEKRKLNFDLPLSNIQLSLPNLYQSLKLIYIDSIQLLKEQQKHSENQQDNNTNNNNNNIFSLLKPDNSFLNGNNNKPLPAIPKIYKQLPAIPTTTANTNTRIQLRPAPIPKEFQK